MNKKIENKTKELIQKYAEYRGAIDERITYENLLEVQVLGQELVIAVKIT